MEVSVIIPCRRAGRFASSMLAQLSAQTFRGEWEAIFVDDADPDLAEWRNEVERSGFRFLESYGRGVSAARNTALEAALGDVILFGDVDDEIAPDYIERMVASIDGVDFAWGDAEVREEGELPRSSRSDAKGPSIGDVVKDGAVKDFVWRRCFGYRLRDLVNLMLPGGIWNRTGREFGGVWARAFRKSVIGDLRFVESLRNAEDSIFLCGYALRARTMRVIGPVGYTYFLRRGGSLARENRGARKLISKFALRDARLALDPEKARWRGSFLLSVLEVLRMGGLRAAVRYATGKSLRLRNRPVRASR